MIKMYTADELADVLRVTIQTARNLIINKHIKGFKVGREWRVTETELTNYINRKSEKGE